MEETINKLHQEFSELSQALSVGRPSWDEYFMMMAKLAATRSTCYSRPVGAVIVRDRRLLATGYNGAPPGTWHCTDEKKCFWRQPENHVPGIEPRELSRAIHAEMNAIAHAARKGISIEGGTLYCTLSPCINCFKVVISAGIKEVFFEHIYDFNNNGGDKFLLDYYAQYKNIISVKQLKITDQGQRTAIQFLSDITSKRRHDHYS
ncbi:MAG: dCMP deaminase family protein [Candidatus Omnitrophota bacterium]